MRARPLGKGLLAACAISALAVGALACEPTAQQGLSAVGVAIAADQAGTRALEGHGIDVRWLTCKAEVRRPSASPAKSDSASASASADGVARVDCEGKALSGEDIAVKGEVTEEAHGSCIRGNLVGEAAGKPVFRADVLGDCGSKPTASSRPQQRPGNAARPQGSRPTVTETVTPAETLPTSPVTVTVTATPEPRPTVTETVTPSEPPPTTSPPPTKTPLPWSTPPELPPTTSAEPEPGTTSSPATDTAEPSPMATPSPSCTCDPSQLPEAGPSGS